MVSIPIWRKQLRWASIGYGLLIFFWMGPEDNQTWPVVLISSGAAILLATVWLSRRFGGTSLGVRQILALFSLLGAITGGGASVITALLMLFKNARHAHLIPDYPPALMGAILERSPIWSLAGALVGLGISLLWVSTKTDWINTHQ